MMKKTILVLSIGLMGSFAQASTCDALPSHEELTKALKSVVATTSDEKNGGLEFNMWATVVARDGTVCAVTKTGENVGDQWPGSRVISAQKANTANAFSLPGLALSTANLFTATQPGGSLFGLGATNPVDTSVAYRGNVANFGKTGDPMVGERVGGVNVFGGGLALYNAEGKIVGGLGVSGDTSCADHNIAWKTRDALKLDFLPEGGVSESKDDNIVYDQSSAHAHIVCGNNEVPIAKELPKTHPISKKQ